MKHGTVPMYRKELRESKKGGPTPCDACTTAQAEYIAGYRLLKPRDRSAETRNATIKRRALTRLAEEFPGAYQRLLTEERERMGA